MQLTRSLVRVIAATALLAGCSSQTEVQRGDKRVSAGNEHPDAAAIQGPKAPGFDADGGLEDPQDVLIPSDEAVCGDGKVSPEELCDDGNRASGDGCSSDCQIVEEGFTCHNPGATCRRARVCGDGLQTPPETCDDGNDESGDGCTSSCLLENGYVCPSPGEDCIYIVECGDGVVAGDESCDDGNADSGDGCNDTCELEEGWTCAVPAAPCRADCGDSLVEGRETCDDGNETSGDGCSETCRAEPGWVCDTPGKPCREAVCGDGKAEGGEACDDGNNHIIGDGCSPGCVLEPDCSDGACASRCGDGLILAGDDEQCDDGNDVSGDGCSAQCTIEEGYQCSNEGSSPPETLRLPILYRDFNHKPARDATRHPDFQYFFGRGVTEGLVEDRLAGDGKPVYTGLCEEGSNFTAADCPHDEQTTSKQNFDQWYRDVDGVNLPLLDQLTFDRQPDGTYVFEIVDGLFPFDDDGWVALGDELTSPENDEVDDSPVHNYGFTSELRYWFEFQGDEFLEFSGDDDVWVFIGGRLAVDIGGLHPRQVRSVTLDDAMATNLGLQQGRVYEIALFHAERRITESNFKLSLKGFSSTASDCRSICGDGTVTADEACDDGQDNGTGYGFCAEDCTPGPRCGDGIVNDDSPEQCDNGQNLDGYAMSSDACGPGCKLPPTCGDGFLDARFGEACDAGENNDGSYGGCNEDCTLAPHCGDGFLDEGEECDDGNNRNDDKCDVECRRLERLTR